MLGDTTVIGVVINQKIYRDPADTLKIEGEDNGNNLHLRSCLNPYSHLVSRTAFLGGANKNTSEFEGIGRILFQD